MVSGPRTYAFVIFALALAAAVLRLSRAHSYAEVQIERLQEPRRRLKRQWVSTLALVLASALTVLGVLRHVAPWFWLAVAVAWLSALQLTLALWFRRPEPLAWAVRIIGVLFGVIAVLIYLLLVR